MRTSFLNLLAASFILFTTATTTSHPQTPARLPFNSFPLLSREACPTEQICGEICCPPPSICDPGAFDWCHSPLTEEVDLCEAGKEVCPDGVSCCRIGYICDMEARMCLAPSTTVNSASPTASAEADDTGSSSAATSPTPTGGSIKGRDLDWGTLSLVTVLAILAGI